MNISSQFSEILHAYPGYETTVSDGISGYLILFTGISYPDDQTKHLNYSLIPLDPSKNYARDISTDDMRNVIDVDCGKLSLKEAGALRANGMYVSNLFIEQSSSF